MDANAKDFDLDMLTKADIGLFDKIRYFADHINHLQDNDLYFYRRVSLSGSGAVMRVRDHTGKISDMVHLHQTIT